MLRTFPRIHYRARRIGTRPLSSLESPEFAEFLDYHLDVPEGDAYEVQRFHYGQSNPTFLISFTSGRRVVVRKQPPGKLLPGAHRVDREYQAMAALHGAFPVPQPIVYHDKPGLLGTPFFVYEYSPGTIYTDPNLPDLPPDRRSRVYHSLAATLGHLHSLPVPSALAGFGPPSGFLARQARVWAKQYEASTKNAPRGLTGMPELAKWLPDRLGEIAGEDWTAVTHGDFRLDNCVFREDDTVGAVLDWELSTLGHPLADAAFACLPFHLPVTTGPVTGLTDASRSRGSGVPSEADFVSAYTAAVLNPASPGAAAVLNPEAELALEGPGDGLPRDWHFFSAFAAFRAAAILQGVRARAALGNAAAPNARAVGDLAVGVARAAAEAAARHDARVGHHDPGSAFSAPAAADTGAAAARVEGSPPSHVPWVGLAYDTPPAAAAAVMSADGRRVWTEVHAFLRDMVLPLEAEILSHNTESPLRWSAEHPASNDLARQAKEAGLWNLFLPPSARAAGLTPVGLSNTDYAPVAELMGHSLVAPQVFNCHAPDSGNMELLAQFGTDAQKQRWLQPLLDGTARSCFGMTEPGVASSDATNMETTVRREGASLVVSGRKWWTTGATDPLCRFMIVLCRDADQVAAAAPSHQRHSMVIVPMDTEGVRVTRPLRVLGFDDAPHGHAEVDLCDVRVPAQNLIVGPGAGFSIAQARLGPGRIHHCMRLIGMSERATALMAQRADERSAFGRPLSEQGTVRAGLAESRLAIDQARLLTLHTAARMDAEGAKAARREVAMIKAVAPRVACAAVDRAMQVFGGAGLSQDTPLAHMYAAARALRLADGPDEVHVETIARLELASSRRGVAKAGE